MVVAGASPVAAAIGRIAHATGYQVFHAALAEDHGLIPEAMRTVDGFDLAPLDLSEQDFVVVAAQGKRDLDALRAALLSPAAYVAMVASSRKARTLLDQFQQIEQEIRTAVDDIYQARIDSGFFTSDGEVK